MLLPQWESSSPALGPYRYFKNLKKNIKNILLSNIRYTAEKAGHLNTFSFINNIKNCLGLVNVMSMIFSYSLGILRFLTCSSDSKML